MSSDITNIIKFAVQCKWNARHMKMNNHEKLLTLQHVGSSNYTFLRIKTECSRKQYRPVNDIMNIDQKPSRCPKTKTKSFCFVWQNENLKQLKSSYWFLLSYHSSQSEVWFRDNLEIRMNPANHRPQKPLSVYESLTCHLCILGCGRGTIGHQRARWRN